MTATKKLIDAVAPTVAGMVVTIDENVRDARLTIAGSELVGALNSCTVTQNWAGGTRVVLELHFSEPREEDAP